VEECARASPESVLTARRHPRALWSRVTTLLERMGLRNRALLGILLVALAVRVYLVWRVNGREPNDASRLFGDSIGYDNVAIALLDGDFFSYPARVPGYSTFLAVVHVITRHDYDRMLYAQAVIGALAVVPTFVLGRKLFDDRVGLLAALGVAVHWGLANESTVLFSEVLYTPVLLCALILLLRVFDVPTAGRAVVAGIAMAAVTLIRPTTIGFAVAVLAVSAVLLGMRQALRVTLAFAVGMLLLLAPWSIRNSVVHDTYQLSSSIGVLYYGSPIGYDWFVRQDRDFYGNDEGTGVWDVELNPDRNGGYDPHLIEGDRHLTRLGAEAITDRPATYAWYSLIKAGWLWAGGPFDWYGGGYFELSDLQRSWPGSEGVWVLVSRLLFAPALVAVVVLWRLWRRLLPLYGVLVYFTVFHGLTWAEIRYSEPLAPLLLILVAAGALALLNRRQRMRRRPSASASSTDDGDERETLTNTHQPGALYRMRAGPRGHRVPDGRNAYPA
jgi:hypothetical protein